MDGEYVNVSADDLYQRVRTHVSEMLEDRKYTDIQSQKDMITCFDGDKKVIVSFLRDDKLTIKILRVMVGMDAQRFIVVSITGPTSFTKREIHDQKHEVEIFSFKDFAINISRHSEVPWHEKITCEEREQLLEKIGSPDGHCLPRLLKTDAMCRYHGFEKGDIIKIIRKFGCQEARVYYRIVWDA